MTDTILERIRALCIVVFLAVSAFAATSLIGCATVQTPGTQQIDEVIASGIIDKPVLSPDDRAQIKTTLTQARSDIVRATVAQEEAEKRVKSSETWATRGKWLAGGLAAGVGLILLGIGAGIVRKIIGG